jgi:hypothetical protein
VADPVGRAMKHEHDDGGERLREHVQEVDHVLEAFAAGSTDSDDVWEVTRGHVVTVGSEEAHA